MKFGIGKFYQHSSGDIMHIISRVTTTFYGEGLLSESRQGDLTLVGDDEDHALNWHEVSGWGIDFYEANNIPEPTPPARPPQGSHRDSPYHTPLPK